MAESITQDVEIFDAVKSELLPLLPSDWQYMPYGKFSGVLDAPTVWITLGTYARSKSNPQGSRILGLTVTVVTPNTVLDERESELYELLIALVDAIDDAPHLHWSDDAVMGMSNQYLGFDIPIQVLVNKNTAEITDTEEGTE